MDEGASLWVDFDAGAINYFDSVSRKNLRPAG
jgi:hypothetical protein